MFDDFIIYIVSAITAVCSSATSMAVAIHTTKLPLLQLFICRIGGYRCVAATQHSEQSHFAVERNFNPVHNPCNNANI